jgi:hypothetical protein
LGGYAKGHERKDANPCTSGATMSEALIELLFWVVVFVVFFYGFKWLQNRKKRKDTENEK